MHNPKLSKKFFIPLLFLICFLTFLVVRTLTYSYFINRRFRACTTPSSPPTYPAIRLTFTTHLPTLNPPASKIIPSLSEPSIPHSSPVRRFSLKTDEP